MIDIVSDMISAGMGVTPYAGGVTVRVWAPNATALSVQWTGVGGTQVATMQSERGGRWSTDIAGMVVGDTYCYLIATSSGLVTRVDPYTHRALNTLADASASTVYDESSFAWNDQPWNSPGWSELVIYELHVGSFVVATGENVGTFDDVITKLSYLRDLGINAIELLPVIEFEGDQSWGYDPGVPFSISRGYGGPDGLKRLVDAAHDHGIVVILDVVYNHLGPADSILWQFDGSGEGWEAGIYFYGARWPGDGRPQTPWGSRPDYGRPEVRQYFCDNVLQWLGDYRAGGLRFDATEYIRSIDGSGDPSQAIPDGWTLLQEINEAVAMSQSWKLTIAEDMRAYTAITAPISQGGAGFASQWDPDFLNSARGVLEAVSDDDRDMTAVAAIVGNAYRTTASQRVIFTESHDADGNGRTRVPTAIDPDQPDSWWSKKRSTLGAALVFTSPGISMLFQGQEFLEPLPFIQSPPPLDWGNVDRYPGILQLYRDLISLRRDFAGTTKGLQGDGVNVFHVNDADKLIGYHRFAEGGPGDDVLVIANFGSRTWPSYTVGVPRPGTWRIRFNSDWSGYDSSYANSPTFDTSSGATPMDGFNQRATIGIGPYTAVILSQDH